LLLKSGAAPNVQDNEGRTALFEASAYGNARTLRMLLPHVANVNVTDRYSKTALMMASGDRQELPNNPGNPESEKAWRDAGAK
jgi:ankyrin repeat protein